MKQVKQGTMLLTPFWPPPAAETDSVLRALCAACVYALQIQILFHMHACVYALLVIAAKRFGKLSHPLMHTVCNLIIAGNGQKLSVHLPPPFSCDKPDCRVYKGMPRNEGPRASPAQRANKKQKCVFTKWPHIGTNGLEI